MSPIHKSSGFKSYVYDFRECSRGDHIHWAIFLEMIWLLKNCELVITNNGGLQKETYFFEKYCVIMRDETEWVELVENSELMKIIDGVDTMVSKSKKGFEMRLYGYGDAGEKILNTLSSMFNLND